MGMAMSNPQLMKEIVEHDISYFETGVCSMQGCRPNMEDAALFIREFTTDRYKNSWLIGVFDGHSGDGMSTQLMYDLYDRLNVDEEGSTAWDQARIDRTCVDFDREVVENLRASSADRMGPGSTAVFAVITPTWEDSEGREIVSARGLENQPEGGVKRGFHVLACNIGDSRIVLVTESGQIKGLTTDHKPTDPEELRRISEAGGFVANGRVDGSLALSRAFGDGMYKDAGRDCREWKVTAVPTFEETVAHAEDLLVVACDGLFETLSTEQIGRATHLAHRDAKWGVADVATRLVDYSLIFGSQDNMTCQVLKFKATPFAERRTEDFIVPGPFFLHATAAYRSSWEHLLREAGLCGKMVSGLIDVFPSHEDRRDFNTMVCKLQATYPRIPTAPRRVDEVLGLPRAGLEKDEPQESFLQQPVPRQNSEEATMLIAELTRKNKDEAEAQIDHSRWRFLQPTQWSGFVNPPSAVNQHDEEDSDDEEEEEDQEMGLPVHDHAHMQHEEDEEEDDDAAEQAFQTGKPITDTFEQE